MQKAHILVVDDEEMIRTIACELLRGAGYEATPAENGRAALELYSRQPDQFDVVLLDMRMPGMDGIETFRALRQADDAVRVVIASGLGNGGADEGLPQDGSVHFIQKPYRLADLTQVLEAARAAN